MLELYNPQRKTGFDEQKGGHGQSEEHGEQRWLPAELPSDDVGGQNEEDEEVLALPG
jgi:hypothetical protein